MFQSDRWPEYTQFPSGSTPGAARYAVARTCCAPTGKACWSGSCCRRCCCGRSAAGNAARGIWDSSSARAACGIRKSWPLSITRNPASSSFNKGRKFNSLINLVDFVRALVTLALRKSQCSRKRQPMRGDGPCRRPREAGGSRHEYSAAWWKARSGPATPEWLEDRPRPSAGAWRTRAAANADANPN